MKANSRTKTVRATQLTPCMSAPFGHRIHDSREECGQHHPQHLVPVEEGDAEPGRLNAVVEGRPQHRDELHDEQQVPPAPAPATALYVTHRSLPSRCCRAARARVRPP